MADEFKGIGNESLRNVESLKGSMIEISQAAASAQKSLGKLGTGISGYKDQFKEITASANKFAQLQNEAQKSANATTKAFAEQQKQLSVVRSLNAQIDNLYDQMLKASVKEARVLKRQVENLSAARDNARELANEFESLASDSAKLDKSTRWFSILSKVSSDIPGLRKLASPFEAAAKASRETVLNNAKSKSSFEELLKTGKGLTKEKIKELGLEKEAAGLTGKAAAARLKAAGVTAKTESVASAGLKAGASEALSAFGAGGPIVIGLTLIVKLIQFFVEAMFAADKRVTSLAKNLSITKEESKAIYKSLILSKDAINTIFNDTENLVVAFTDLSQITDFINFATNKQIESQIILTKQLELSKEEALGYQEALINSNEDQEKGLDIVYDQIAAFANQNKMTANASAIFKEIGKTSKTIQLNFKGNLTELTKTVLEAKKLGLTLDQVDSVANSLLNFEESISSELEAELLLGQDINLEKARTFALNNDIAGLTKEIANQGITAEKFSRLNRIQQEALAKTLGMNSKELGDSLYQQQLIQRTGGKELEQMRERAKMLRAEKKDSEAMALEKKAALIEQGLLRGEDLKTAKESASAQEKFEQSIKRVQEVFTDLVDGGFLDKLADFVKAFADTIAEGGSLFSFFGGKSDLQKNIEKQQTESTKKTIKELEDKQKQTKLSSEEEKQLSEAKFKIASPEERKKLLESGKVKLSKTEIQSGGEKLNKDEIKTALDERLKKEKESFEGNPFSRLFGLKYKDYKGYENIKKDYQAEGLEIPKLDDFIMRPGQTPIKFNKDDLIIGGTNLMGDNGNNNGSNNEVISLLKQLIETTKQGGNVYLDMQKVGTTVDQSTYKLNS
jgi:hypothetical protein